MLRCPVREALLPKAAPGSQRTTCANVLSCPSPRAPGGSARAAPAFRARNGRRSGLRPGVLCRGRRGDSEHEQGFANDGCELTDSRRLQAALAQRRKRLEKEMLALENALECAARDEKEAIVDKLDGLKVELDEVCGKLLPNSVADILLEYSTVWYIDEDQPEYATVADQMGVVACSGSRLHCAQDVHFNWRWLEDPNAMPMRERPACLKRSAPMSFRQLQELGLNVVCAHRMVAPRSLISFEECSSWEQASAAMAAAAHALRQLKADGWSIDNSTYCSDPSQLLLVKHLPPLRTLQHEAAERALMASPNVAARERGGIARVPQAARPDVAARKKKSRVRSKRVQEEEYEA